MPEASNTSTGGAATQHFASGGVRSAARSRGVSEPGRCTTQMRSWRSVAMPETWPRIQRFGSVFGHVASTSNCGTRARSCACAAAQIAAIASASAYLIRSSRTGKRYYVE